MGTRVMRKIGVFRNFAQELAGLSTCKRASVGCVIVPRDFSQVYAIGYNGPPAGLDNNRCTGIPGQCGCVHAEANATIKLQTTDTDCRMITTTCPCPACAALIINKGCIQRVLYLVEYRLTAGAQLLIEAGIEVRHYTTDLERWWND